MAEPNFFERKEKKETKISKFNDFNHDHDSNFVACGLSEDDNESFVLRNKEFFDDLGVIFEKNSGKNPISSIAECLEKNFSSREISFLLSKTIMSELIENSKK